MPALAHAGARLPITIPLLKPQMRSIGRLADRQHADRFAAYLESQEVRTRVDTNGEQWEVWVVDEDKVAQARQQLTEFLQAPDDPRYLEAIRNSASRKTRQLEDALERRRKEVVNRKMPWERGIPLTAALIMASVFVTAMSQFGNEDIPFTRAMMMSDSKDADRRLDNTPVEIRREADRTIITHAPMKGWEAIPEIRQGEVWRIFTPMFLHFTPLHILFNMLWTVKLAGYVEYMKGTWYLLILILVIEAVAGFSQLYWTGPFSGGMSGVNFGLFGFIWTRSRLAPEEGFQMEPAYVFLFMAWGLICATGSAGPIANAAHFGGLAAGGLIGAWAVTSLKTPR
jgi:GlpG protein